MASTPTAAIAGSHARTPDHFERFERFERFKRFSGRLRVVRRAGAVERLAGPRPWEPVTATTNHHGG